MSYKFMTAAEAASLIKDGDIIGEHLRLLLPSWLKWLKKNMHVENILK